MLFSKKLLFTGERASLSDINGMNLARYEFVLPFVKNKRVLELGCGSGYGTSFLADNGVKKILAFDSSAKSIDFASTNFKNKKITYKCVNIESIRNIGKFNIAISFEVIEHLTSPEVLLKLVKSSLVNEGKFIVSTPNRYQSSYDGNKPSNPYHIREYFPQEFSDLLKKFFKKVDLYGIFLSSSKVGIEKDVHKTWNWKLASLLVRKRWIRQMVNYFPRSVKRFITGEKILNFKSKDFKFSKTDLESASYLLAVCTL